MKIILFIAILLFPTLAMAQNEGVDSNLNCINVELCGIQSPYLANQDTDPFMFSGRIVDEQHPRWRQYRRAIRRFFDVRDCLVESEHKKPQPNLLLIDWKKVGVGENLEVCLFLIARSLQDIELIRQWLTFHQFRAGNLNRTYSENYTPRFETQPITQITAWWTVEQYRQINPSWLAAITGIELIQSYQVIVQFSEKLSVVGVGVVTPGK